LNLLQVLIGKEDPPIILNTMYLDRQKDNNPPFYLSLGMNGKQLNNYMLDFRASANFMSLKVMKQLGLKTNRTYRNVCGIDFKRVNVYGLCEDVEVFFIDFPHISLLMNIVVIDVLDAWGMLLSKSWSISLVGFLRIDLTHAHISMQDETFEVLYSRERANKHVTYLSGPHYTNEDEFDEVPNTIEYNPQDFPFMQEDFIDMLFQKTNEYKEKLAKLYGKEPRSIQILKKEDKEHEEAIKREFNAKPPSYPYIDNIPYINYSEGSIAFMWDKKKGKPKYEKKDDNSWFGPYIVKNKSDKENYYLTTLDGRKMPLPVDGSLLWPYVQVT
jgi:hypothetical protein